MYYEMKLLEFFFNLSTLKIICKTSLLESNHTIEFEMKCVDNFQMNLEEKSFEILLKLQFYTQLVIH